MMPSFKIKRELLLANQEIEQLRIRLVAVSKERGEQNESEKKNERSCKIPE